MKQLSDGWIFTIVLVVGIVFGLLSMHSYRLRQEIINEDRFKETERLLMTVPWQKKAVENWNNLGYSRIEYNPPAPQVKTNGQPEKSDEQTKNK